MPTRCGQLAHAVTRGLSDLCTRIAACLLLANLAGCAHGPKEVAAGKLGTVVLGYPKDDGNIVRFLLPLAFNAYSQNEAVPSDLSQSKDEVKKRLAWLMHSRSGVLWIGHSTFLIRWGGLTILTDLIFSDFASPLPPMLGCTGALFHFPRTRDGAPPPLPAGRKQRSRQASTAHR